ncbi:MAG: hypothetical protein KDE20_13280 [Caldilineaceae bacterium]|nr:hypothetical protein [Caldilineaceae bacterium]
MMSGADELDALSHELEEFAHSDDVTAHGGLSEVEHQMALSLEQSEKLYQQGTRGRGAEQ